MCSDVLEWLKDEMLGDLEWTKKVEADFPSCCKMMCKARMCGTDGEGYGSAVDWNGENTHLRIGCTLEPIVFCPWCGMRMSDLWDRNKGRKGFEK